MDSCFWKMSRLPWPLGSQRKGLWPYFLCKVCIYVVLLSICWTLFDNEAFLCWHQHKQRDHNNCHIKPPTNFLKNAKFLHWKSLKSKIFWFPLGKSDWLMNSKCLSNTVQHMWKWAIIPFFVCLNQNFLSVMLGDYIFVTLILSLKWRKIKLAHLFCNNNSLV